MLKVEFHAMRCVLLAILSILVGLAQAQDPLAFTRTDASFVVTEHATSAENVEITMLNPEYPTDLLKTQCEELGRILNVAPRGLAVFVRELNPNDPRMRFVKASFAVNGLIDREQGILNIEPIIKAFAGAPAPYTLKTLSIIFPGEKPTEKTVRKFGIKDVIFAEAKASIDPPGIEYTVVLLSQEPALLNFPTDVTAEKQVEKAKPEPQSNLRVVLSLLVIASLAGGVLVYLALLRRGR